MKTEWTLIVGTIWNILFENWSLATTKRQLNALCLQYVSSALLEHIAVSSSSISLNFASRRQRTRQDIIIRRFLLSVSIPSLSLRMVH